MRPKQLTRRAFLGRGALAAGGAALFSIVPRRVLGGPGYTAPSAELTKAVIGVGGMGTAHLTFPGSRLLAVCEVDSKRLSEAVRLGGPDVKGYRDYREVLERSDIDIVHIATPPHWHAGISIAAARAGKDIWCEKPMTRTIGEGLRVIDAVRRHGRMFRVNTWFRFRDNFYELGAPARMVRKVVAAGVLGWPLRATLGAPTGFDWKLAVWSGRTDLVPQPVPSELDYDAWLGPAPWKPYHPLRVHGNFRGYWDYDGGGLGDMGMHYLDPVQYILGKDGESPVEIEADTPQQHFDAVSPWRRVILRYSDGCEIVLDGDGSRGDAPFLEGPGGKIFRGFRCEPANLESLIPTLPEPEPAITEFSDSVRTRRKFALNEDNAFRSTTLVNLAKIAVRLGRPLRFDPATLTFPADAAANRLLDEPERAPWSV